MYSLQFKYDKRGFGLLCFYDGDRKISEYACRTGSITQKGELVNAIYTGTWTMQELPVWTDEEAMRRPPEPGWKVRLWTPGGSWSRFLIHPDGGKPGSAGCIVLISTAGIPLRDNITKIMDTQSTIPVEVSTT
jgi:hypothetical protein